ncbi:MAG TPA: response regulator [Verrucomicrobiae bacterium]
MKDKIILLVEDNADDVKLTLQALKRNHIVNEVSIARDGVEALEYLSRAPALPAVILLDLKLPRVDGLEVLRQVRGTPRFRRLPVVVLTSSKEEQDVVKSYDLGANSYIRKPVDFAQFTEAVKQLGMYWLLLNEAAPSVPERPLP